MLLRSNHSDRESTDSDERTGIYLSAVLVSCTWWRQTCRLVVEVFLKISPVPNNELTLRVMRLPIDMYHASSTTTNLPMNGTKILCPSLTTRPVPFD